MERAARAVNTVLGPVPASELGVTLMHEHLIIGFPGVALDPRWIPDRAAMVAVCLEQVSAAKRAGVRTIVDATSIDMGRDPHLLAEVAARAGVQIVCSTGLYSADYGLPVHFRLMSGDDLAALFVSEIEQGIGKTGIRAGVIKVATSGPQMHDAERHALVAAAEAQKRTGVPIISHTNGGGGDEQARLLIENGVNPRKVVIGHVDHKDSSARYLLRILRQGVCLGFDRVGLEGFMPDWLRAALVAGLFRQGFGARLILSTDATAWWVGPPPEVARDAPPPYRYLLEDFAPRLSSLGLTQGEVSQMLEANPAALFAG